MIKQDLFELAFFQIEVRLQTHGSYKLLYIDTDIVNIFIVL